jgi:glycerophosphoryl diester phosphodiesterase
MGAIFAAPVIIIGAITGLLVSLIVILLIIGPIFLIRPRAKKPQNERLICDYAHRGLHGNGIPENSLAAFELACQDGYGIELDVQLSRDGEVMVFHDYTLVRMTGDGRKLCEVDAAELQGLALAGTDQFIPTLREVLALVDGRVPILVELKGESFDTALCPKVAEILKSYTGDYCVESFNPLLIKDIQKHLPGVYCGLLYTNACKEKKKYSIINIAVSCMLLNFLAKPNFIAFNKNCRRSVFVKLTTGLYKAPKFVWTVKSEEEFNQAHSNGECAILER